MRRILGGHHKQTPPTSATTGSGNTSSFPRENNVGVSLTPNSLVPIESGLTVFRSSVEISSARSAVIASMDEEIESARLHVRALLTRRNALALISVLPPELLSRIFHFLVLEEPSWSTSESLGWIKITHVCQHWRQVALEDSSLWTTISGYPESSDWITEMLARAKLAPLTIDLTEAPSKEIFSLFPSRLSYIRELRLHGLSLYHIPFVQKLCSQGAPILEHFELNMSDVNSPVSLPLSELKFFEGHAPKLRSFSLYQASIPWSHLPHAQLSQLSIALSREASGATLRDTLDQFIGVLANSPGLEDLVLHFCLPSLLSHLSLEHIIHLPRLSHLGLAGSTSRVANLLKMLKLPSSAKLHLRCVADDFFATCNDDLILPLILAHFSNPNPLTFKSFSLGLDYVSRSINLIASSSLPTSKRSHTLDSGLEGAAELHLSIDGNFGAARLPNTLARICTTLPISEVEFLFIFASNTDQPMEQPINWGDLFRRCEKITTVEARGQGTTTLLEALTPPKLASTTLGGRKRKQKRKRGVTAQGQGADNATAQIRPPFPKLKTLVLRRMDFSENRQSYNVPLESLTIEYSVISSKNVDALEKAVPDFHFGQDESIDDFDHFDEFDYASDSMDLEDHWEGYYMGDDFSEGYSDMW
ncbi:hypothetical protein BGW80DRAFT_630910 [Lactifluus volemus]|nr:hypothetical protein BGW80DRAFT_630910 [Lactifluus volemus]